jgi:hypothetical protein
MIAPTIARSGESRADFFLGLHRRVVTLLQNASSSATEFFEPCSTHIECRLRWLHRGITMHSLRLFPLYALAFLSIGGVGRADLATEIQCHDKVVRHGLETFTLAKEVNHLFGAANVDHFISNYGSAKRPAVWNSVAFFADRYQLTLRVEISVDAENCSFSGAMNSAIVVINEFESVGFTSSGLAQARFGRQWTLNENEWKNLIKTGGNWRAVKVPIVLNAPISGMADYVAYIRKQYQNREGWGLPAPIKKHD